MQAMEATRLAVVLAYTKPNGLRRHLHCFVTLSLLAIIYDRPMDGMDPIANKRILTPIEEYDLLLEEVLKPGYLIEVFTWTLNIPVAWVAILWKRDGLKNHERMDALFEELLQDTIKIGTGPREEISRYDATGRAE